MNNTNNEHFELLPYQADANREGLPVPLDIDKIGFSHPAYSAASRNLNSSCRIWRCVLPRVKPAFRLLCPSFCTRCVPDLREFRALPPFPQLWLLMSAFTQSECRMQRTQSDGPHSAIGSSLSSPSPFLLSFSISHSHSLSLFLLPNPSWLASETAINFPLLYEWKVISKCNLVAWTGSWNRKRPLVENWWNLSKIQSLVNMLCC